MPLLKAEAEKLSNNDLQAGIIEEIIELDDMFALMPFSRTDGKAYVYNREATISEASFLDPNDVIPEGAATFDEITTHLRIIAGDVDVDKFLLETMSDTSDQRSIQIAQKAKGLGNKFKRTVIQGDNTADAKSFDGLDKLVADTGNEIIAGANGAALSLDMLDELADAVPYRPDAFIMRRGTLRALKTLWRAAGGNTGGLLQIDNYGMMPAHDGTPIVINDYILGDVDQGTETDSCSIFAVRFNEADGVHGLYGGDAAGVRIEDIGTVQNKDAYRYRVKWYAGMALKSTQSAAALRGITNV